MAATVGTALAVAVASGWGQRRRHNRRDVDRVGVIDWRTVQLIALFVAILFGGIWLKA